MPGLNPGIWSPPLSQVHEMPGLNAVSMETDYVCIYLTYVHEMPGLETLESLIISKDSFIHPSQHLFSQVRTGFSGLKKY